MSRNARKLAVLGGGVAAAILVSSAHVCGEIRSLSARLAEAEGRLGKVEQRLGRSAGPAPTSPGPRRIPALLPEAAGARPAAAVRGDGAAAGAPPAAPAVVAAPADDGAGRSEAGERPSPWNDVLTRWRWLRDAQREELVRDLRLSACQADRIAAVLEEESDALERLLTGAATSRPGNGGARERWEEVGRRTDERIRACLTSRQAGEYEAWCQETGGWRGLQFGRFPG